MIIKINESKLFTVDPAIRFAIQYGVPQTLWKELWRRYKLLDYSIPELCEVYHIKVGKQIKRRKMDEWIFRGEVYMKTHDKIKMGVQAVNSSFFGELEQRVLNEVFRHTKYRKSISNNKFA
ncbi:MAG TPA: hypothetical protein PKX08_18945 [Cyclobacteriaceae bacterium]|nr:hypothetical protein [Cyclobacteriaceae bacterium]